MKKLVFFILLAITSLQTWADKVTLTAEAPDVVASGDQFRLTFTINTQKVKDFRAPSVGHFDVLMGPSRSMQSSTQIINGKVSSVSSITYTYILMAGNEGTYTIPAASVEAEGKKIFSNALTIKVLPPDQSGSAQGTSSQSESTVSARSGQTGRNRITDKDLFITAIASKTKVHEQEAVLLTYKVYTLVNLRQLYGKMPDLKGFHNQEVELPQQKTFSLEHYNGRNYHTTVWSQYLLFPQQSGKLEIPSITFDGVIAQRTVSDDPFDVYFNGGGYVEIKKKIVTPKVIINVLPLKNKPAGFSGGVGEFTLHSAISSTELKTNDAVTLKLTIKGVGNMKLISAPEVKFPQDFEMYDPKVTNNFKVSHQGLAGEQVVEYLAIPRHAGNFTIPSIEFSYFDLNTSSFKTIKTESYKLKVIKGSGEGNSEQLISDFTNKESVKVLGKDIRFIKLGNTTYSLRGKFFYGTLFYWLWYIIPMVLSVMGIIFFRKQATENTNIAKVKTKKANKVATKRMKQAGKLLAENKKNEFYDEVLKALWGYISDKLSIPVSLLSKDNIEMELIKYGVSDTLINEFINVLNECEIARYAPGNENEAMDKVYTASIEVISKMENSIKH